MIGLAIHIKNPFDYRKDFTSEEIFDRTTVREQARVFAGADDFARPTICVFNGQPILRDEWGGIISDGDAVIFITLPQGGRHGEKSRAHRIVHCVDCRCAHRGPARGAVFGDYGQNSHRVYDGICERGDPGGRVFFD